MSESPSNATENSASISDKDETNTELLQVEKRKLSLSQSENSFDHQKTIRQKLLGKVKSWSSKDHHSENKSISVELDLARSLSRLEVTDSVNDISSNLLRARDSLENLVKDEQNMPKTSLDKSIILPKPRKIADSPKSSPQLGEKFKASSSGTSFWDPYAPGKKNRKDIKRNKKSGKRHTSPATDSKSMPLEEKSTSIMKKREDKAESGENSTIEEASIIEEENIYKYKYFPKNSKSVVFTNEVLVVYFNNEDVVGEEKEPLKKEVEQQTRNKEMRRIHLNKTQEKYNLCLF